MYKVNLPGMFLGQPIMTQSAFSAGLVLWRLRKDV